jgi:hypothetical protein
VIWFEITIVNPIIKTTLLVFVALAFGAGCGKSGNGTRATYTQEEMVGAFKSDGSPTLTLHLNADGTSLTDYGEGGKFSGKWERVSSDGISTIYDDPSFNANPTFYTILSKDKLKPLLTEEAIKMGISSPTFNRVEQQNH